jgi:isoprenylcysteine carboxyl methyltransferase (ICMT) family protein YpbQ
MVVLVVIVCSSIMMRAIVGLALRLLVLFAMLLRLLAVQSLGARWTCICTVADSALPVDRVLPVVTSVIAVVDTV